MPEGGVGRLTQALAARLNADAGLVEPLLADMGLAPQNCPDAALCDAVSGSVRKHVDAVAESDPVADPVRGPAVPGRLAGAVARDGRRRGGTSDESACTSSAAAAGVSIRSAWPPRA